MSERKDGGPAFPFQARDLDGTPWEPVNGMSLRDYFAGQAITGLLVNPLNDAAVHIAAGTAYLIADALLEAREGS